MKKRIEDYNLTALADVGEMAWKQKTNGFGYPICQEVTDVMNHISRFTFLKPCIELLTDLDAAEVKHMVLSIGQAEPTHIYRLDEDWINSTDQALIALMLSSVTRSGDSGKALVIGSGCGYVPALLRDMGTE